MTDKDKDDTSRPTGKLPDSDRLSPWGDHAESQKGGYDPGEWGGGGGGGGGLKSQGQPENLLQGSGGFVERQGKFWSWFAFWSRDDDGGWDGFDDSDEELEPEEEADVGPSDHSDEKGDVDTKEGVERGYDSGPPQERD